MASITVIANTTGDGLTPATAFRPVFAGMPMDRWASKGCAHKADGSPRFGWGIFRIQGTVAQLANIVALAGVVRFPAALTSLDSPLSLLTQNQFNTLITVLTNHGVTAAASYTGATLCRQVVRDVIKMHEAQADENTLESWP